MIHMHITHTHILTIATCPQGQDSQLGRRLVRSIMGNRVLGDNYLLPSRLCCTCCGALARRFVLLCGAAVRRCVLYACAFTLGMHACI